MVINKRIHIILLFVASIILMVILLPGRSNGSVKYVDKAAQGSNDGSTWTNAWQSFNSITGLSKGDTVYISGGDSAQIYNETLICEEGVNYFVGQEAKYNGKVIIDVEEKREHCIILQNNVTISGKINDNEDQHIICRNSTKHGIIKKGSSTDIRLLYIEVEKCGRIKDTHGIRLTNAKGGCEVAFCSVHDNYYDGINSSGSRGHYGANSIHDCIIYNNSDDGINLKGGFDIYNNTIHSNWRRPGVVGKPHPDGIQAQGIYLRIYNNKIYDNHTFQIFVNQINISEEEKGGYAIVYNNTCFITDKTHVLNGFGIAYKAEASVKGVVTDVFFFNNTVVDMGYSGIHIHNKNGIIENSFIMNNIIYNCRTSGTYGYVCGTTDTEGVKIDYNLINSGELGGNRMEWGGQNFDYRDFIANGFGQINGQTDAPQFLNYTQWNSIDLSLDPNDVAARRNGKDLSKYFTNLGLKYEFWDIGVIK